MFSHQVIPILRYQAGGTHQLLGGIFKISTATPVTPMVDLAGSTQVRLTTSGTAEFLRGPIQMEALPFMLPLLIKTSITSGQDVLIQLNIS